MILHAGSVCPGKKGVLFSTAAIICRGERLCMAYGMLLTGRARPEAKKQEKPGEEEENDEDGEWEMNNKEIIGR